jgi:hypothetical protein
MGKNARTRDSVWVIFQSLNKRNKYLAVKLYHFWMHVKPGIIEVVKCDTRLMLAFIYQAPCEGEIFEREESNVGDSTMTQLRLKSLGKTENFSFCLCLSVIGHL